MCTNCNQTPCNPCSKCCDLRYKGPDIDSVGIETNMTYDDVIETLSEYIDNLPTSSVNSIIGTDYNPSTGELTIYYSDGSTFSTGDLRGPTGATGPVGPAGVDGQNDGHTLSYKFHTSTAGYEDDGYITFINSNPALVDYVYISKLDNSSVNQQAFLLSTVNSELNITPVLAGAVVMNRYGILKIYKSGNLSTYVNYEVQGVLNNLDHVEFRVKYLDHTGSFALDDDITINFIPYQTITSELRYDIYNWNMDTTTNFNIPVSDLAPHGCNPAGIADVQVMIVSDNIVTPLIIPLNGITTGTVNGGVLHINSTDIVLQRTTGGVFDDANFSATGFRGFALIKYYKTV